MEIVCTGLGHYIYVAARIPSVSRIIVGGLDSNSSMLSGLGKATAGKAVPS